MTVKLARADASAPAVRLYLLGPFHVEGASGPVHLSRRKTASLLAYLVLHPEPHLREELAALCWGDSSDERARHSLRTSLADLRHEFHDDLLFLEGETVQLNPKFPVWADALEFKRRLLAGAQLEQGVSLYQGDLMSDCYDDWVTPEREHYRGLYLEALMQLAQDMRASGQYERAIAYAQKILAQDPASERAHQHLMFCYLAAGDRSAALKQFEKCQQVLSDEFAVEPAPETLSLYQRIKRGSTQLPAPQALPTNLPIPLTSFVGRKAEIAEARRLLTRSRLVTLTGAGGCGKSRLATQVAKELVGNFPDGIWWVDLASLASAEFVPAAVARVLGIQEVSNQPLGETLVAFVGQKRLLLVLDNCEHLLTACRQVVGVLLASCANLTILTTSREALGITGEVTRQVPALTLPDATQPSEAKSLLKYEGVRLFSERAGAVNHEFALTSRNSTAVSQICRRLDGIPLAIELAAARTKVLSAEQIAERLDDCLNLLKGGNPAAAPRHQTLRASIDCSYDLLTAEERGLFRRLAVFAGGFTLEAVELIVDAEKASRLAADFPSTLDLLAQLVDKSLISAVLVVEQVHYSMLNTIQRYALEKLSEEGETEGCRDRHLAYFTRLAEAAEPHLTSSNRDAWLLQLDAEHGNLLAALEWSQRPKADVHAGLTLAGALYWYWFHRGLLTEGRTWLEKAVARAEEGGEPSGPGPDRQGRAIALFALGSLAEDQGEQATAKPLLEESIALWRQSGPVNTRGVAHALVILSRVLRLEGNPAAARAKCEEAVQLFRELGDQWGEALALLSLGLAMRDQEEYDLARSQIHRGILIFERLGDEFGRSAGLSNLGLVDYRQGHYKDAVPRLEKAVAIQGKIGIKSRIVYTINVLALVTLCQGNDAEAQRLFEQCENLARDLGERFMIANCLRYFGHLAMFRDEPAIAEVFYTQALERGRRVGPVYLRALCLLGFAALAAVQGQPERAARLWGASEAQIAKGASFFDAADRRLYARTIAKAEAQLGAQAFEALRAEGKAMTMDQAIEYALNP